jgi:hypothetical protein
MMKKSAVVSIVLVLLLSITTVVQAQTVTALWGFPYTMDAPDSQMTCSPTGSITTYGLEGQSIFVYFYAQNPVTGNMDELPGTGYYTGNLTNYAFPYPATISGSQLFETLVLVYVGDTILTKLQAYWTVTCTPTPPPPPPGDEGCTPGYWRNHPEDWPVTGYAWTDDYDATFGVDYFAPDITLGTAIWMGGGGVKVLARHGTAALLSAAHPDVNYPYSVAQVIAFVQAGNVAPLVEANELGCSIP